MLLLQNSLLVENRGTLYRTETIQRLIEVPTEEGCELLLQEVLMNTPPIWLFTATSGGELGTEMIPDADLANLDEAIPDHGRREALLLTLANRIDREANETLGERGEEVVVNSCRTQLIELGRPDLAEKVQRVSLISDQLGYDVTAPRANESSRRLEVKTTSRRGSSLTVYLSRNELTYGLRDPDWMLVICQATEVGPISVVGWCHAGVLEPSIPRDVSSRAAWVSARFDLSLADLELGLPPA
jgi:hypothetical protein